MLLHCMLVCDWCTHIQLQIHIQLMDNVSIYSVNDIEEKYYADGEDAYDMRKPFKDVKSKPAILPKGSRQSQAGDGKKKSSAVSQAPASASPDSTVSEQPAAKTSTDKSDKKSSDGDDKAALSASPGAEGSEPQPKAKAARDKKR